MVYGGYGTQQTVTASPPFGGSGSQNSSRASPFVLFCSATFLRKKKTASRFPYRAQKNVSYLERYAK
jgi:hypothetical protein